MRYVAWILPALVIAGALLVTACPTTLLDDYEPNDTIAGFFDLGPVADAPSESSWSATISPAGDDDFYGITAEDPDTLQIPGTAEHLTLTVRMVPPQPPDARNYDLYLYNEAGAVLDSSTNLDSADEAVTFTWDGTVGLDDSADFRVEVRGVGGDISSVPYTVYASLLETSP